LIVVLSFISLLIFFGVEGEVLSVSGEISPCFVGIAGSIVAIELGAPVYWTLGLIVGLVLIGVVQTGLNWSREEA